MNKVFTWTRMAQFALALGALFSAACGGEPVGRLCDLGAERSTTRAVTSLAALDCTSRFCLSVPLEPGALGGENYPAGETKGLCSNFCESSDDCERVSESPCKSGFTCGIATEVGDICCQKVCICKDFIRPRQDENGQDTYVIPTPESCLPENAANSTCRNL